VKVAYPPSWGISAGIGYEASAVDINSGWHPTDAAAKRFLFERLKPIYLGIFDKTPEDFESLETQRFDSA
jgi:hypothetical protein